jgi:hypothetical protein
MLTVKTMKEKKRGPYNTIWLFLGSAIVAAIKRCEVVCNPAIVRRPKFTIHVLRLTEGPTHSWVVTCSNREAFTNGREEHYDNRKVKPLHRISLQDFKG